jgi:conjugal transfer pilus assembly protein TraB
VASAVGAAASSLRGAVQAASGPSLKVLAVAAPSSPASATPAKTGSHSAEAAAADKGAPADASVENYVPSGSFARAVMLNGLDAPTGGNAQQNPHPVLLQLLDDATLPNRFKSRLQSCFVTAAAHGDISSERAFVRLDRMSCIDEDGGAVDIKVQGYVAGEDGKTGLRGRLVTKSGQVLANALLTGLLSGIGKGIQADSVQQNTTITGAVTTQVKDPWRAGLGEGIGKAMEEVSRYYLRLADKIFPIIEVDAGRVVDVVFTRGLSIERHAGGNK